ncbi:hypothetical protein V9K67_03615 [Paraflavisolibacter sp. H34]|uniref:hypothetical protein n=1 Tax=Huijunlia imazamoxiresistens TaxID=3127457 RepID=UPI003015E661
MIVLACGTGREKLGLLKKDSTGPSNNAAASPTHSVHSSQKANHATRCRRRQHRGGTTGNWEKHLFSFRWPAAGFPAGKEGIKIIGIELLALICLQRVAYAGMGAQEELFACTPGQQPVFRRGGAAGHWRHSSFEQRLLFLFFYIRPAGGPWHKKPRAALLPTTY